MPRSSNGLGQMTFYHQIRVRFSVGVRALKQVYLRMYDNLDICGTLWKRKLLVVPNIHIINCTVAFMTYHSKCEACAIYNRKGS